MPKLTIFHNPSCTKSKRSVACLQTNKTDTNYDLEIIEYQINPPSSDILATLSSYLGLTEQNPASRPWDYLLRPEAQGKANSFEEAFAIIQVNPSLLERPFVIDWDRKLAVLGRPDISQVERMVTERVALANKH
ncbi:uncharacterized protein B0P05DRAFT_557392 [Gilbertella persicaria]|uniref:uncharacterized protein n=1 Tax=Gilbertella persicaria TaxID=101096 RepID=UPI00221F350F|nr:uncharacterized protein B0P05DRAFT_557392 [Gilbertella persicaria]KAI8061529.1 hypothetical protein B0P05DRAFT_557392 [Gilbertella persicaria]